MSGRFVRGYWVPLDPEPHPEQWEEDRLLLAAIIPEQLEHARNVALGTGRSYRWHPARSNADAGLEPWIAWIRRPSPPPSWSAPAWRLWIFEGISYGGVAFLAMALGIRFGLGAIAYPLMMPLAYVATRIFLARWEADR